MSSSLADQLAEQLTKQLAQWGFSWRGLGDNRHGEWWLIGQLSLIALAERITGKRGKIINA